MCDAGTEPVTIRVVTNDSTKIQRKSPAHWSWLNTLPPSNNLLDILPLGLIHRINDDP